MEAGEGEGAGQAPLVGFLFGNVDENNRVEADYLDEDARDHLGGLARVQGGALDLQEELRAGQQPGAGSAAADAAAVQPAPDARDFADEAELIEDAEQQSAAAAAMRQRQLGVVTAALRSGEAAEDEDYDEEDEEEAPAAHALQPPLAPVPIVAAAVDARLTPRMQREYRQHVRLPVLGHSMDGEAVLRFSELYGHQGVMAGHVSTTDELRPPALLRRRQHRHAAQRLRQQRELAAERDEEALLHLADLEAPAEDVEEHEDQAADQPTFPTAVVAAGPLSDTELVQQQRRQQEQWQEQAGTVTELDSLECAGADSADEHAADTGPMDGMFACINTLAWEDRIQWDGRQPACSSMHVREAAVAAAVAGAQDQQEAGPRVWGTADQSQLAFPQADIAAMFQQQQQQQDLQLHPADFQHPQSLDGRPETGDELPGLHGTAPQHIEARAAVESDEDECWALPTGPLLRLEQLLRAGTSASEPGQQLIPAPDMLPVHCNSWEQRIAWEGSADAHKLRLQGPALDLNDASQSFELTRPLARQPAASAGSRQQAGATATEHGTADHAALIEKAAALILEPQVVALPLPPRGSGFNAVQPEEVELWRLHQGLAREREYHQAARRRTGAGVTVRVLNAKLAIDLATLPILNPTPQTHDELLALALWHTPRGRWWPMEIDRVSMAVGGVKKKKCGPAGPVSLTITSLPGFSKHFQTVDLHSRLADLWKHLLEKVALFKPGVGSQPLIYLPGQPPMPLPLDQPLVATGAVREGQRQVTLALVFQDVQLLQTAAADSVPANDNPALLRPPNAFSRKRDMSAAEPGHVVLLEYMEQQPPLISRPGMGAKLVTYYCKKDAADTEHQKLKQETPCWRVGTVQPLGDDDDSPFLGQLAPGGSSLSVESGLFRSLAFPYTPPPSDFLLLRSQAGFMQLRELTGTIVVGQELPMLRVPAPTAREVKELEERRIYVHVFKHLRVQQAKLDKDPVKQGQRACISLKALAEAFPSRPPAMIRTYLKDTCDLAVRTAGDTDYFSLKQDARPPSEAELRKKLTPEEACALEACYVAAFRMKQRGLVLHEKLDKAAIEKLRLAAEMLPPDEGHQKAARLVEQAMQSAPWSLTDAFVTHFREGKAHLQLAGAADPTGRGFGYSFVKDVRHKHANADDVTKQMAKRQAGKVQGTDADLRRMTTAQAKERLRGYGMTDDDFQSLGRWTMIDMVRQLASAAAQDGTVDAAAIKFVRHQKTTMLELQRRAAEKAQQIIQKQLAVLSDAAGEDLGDQDALEAELERELAAAEEAAEAEGASKPNPHSNKGKHEGTPTPDDEQRMMQQMRAEGLMATAAGGAAGSGAAGGSPAPVGSGGPPPKEGAGTKRIRREVFLKAADGSWQKSHEVMYIGRDRPGQLHSLYQKEGAGSFPYGFGTRTVAGRPKDLRLSYSAARGRGLGRAGGNRPGAGRGRGGGKGRATKAQASGSASSDVTRARQSTRQRKQRQFGDEMLDGDLVSDDDEYDEEGEAPYFASLASPANNQPPKPKASRKKKKAPEGLELPALPDDFAAAVMAAAAINLPNAPAQSEQQQQQQQQTTAVGMEHVPPAAGEGGDQQRAPSMQQPQSAGGAAVPKLKFKLAAAPVYKREPSPDYVYNYAVDGGEDDDEEVDLQRRRSSKTDDADYEAPPDDGSDFELDEDLASEDSEERRYQNKARARMRNSNAHLARAGTRRSGGSAGGSRKGGAAWRPVPGGKRTAGGGGARVKAGGGGSGGRRPKRSRSDFEDDDEDFEDVTDEEEEEEEELADEGDTSDEGSTPLRVGKLQPSPALGVAGQLGTVGRQLGAILGSIVQQLRNVRKLHSFNPGVIPAKMCKVYDLVFGKAPSPTQVPDYNQVVPKPSVITLADMQKKARTGRYLTLEQFRADLRQLYANAVAYNTPGRGGQFGHPSFIEIADDLQQDAEAQIAQHIGEIQDAEAASAYVAPSGYAAPYQV